MKGVSVDVEALCTAYYTSFIFRPSIVKRILADEIPQQRTRICLRKTWHLGKTIDKEYHNNNNNT
jgi:hypothetical protein